MWKENVMEEMEAGEVEYESAEEFLITLRKEFGRGEEESVKAAELRKMEQGGRTMEEYVQEFKRVARGSGYEGRPQRRRPGRKLRDRELWRRRRGKEGRWSTSNGSETRC